MKVSHIGIIAVMLVVIAVALAGCATTQTTTKSGDFGQTTPAAGASGASSSGASSSGAASSSGGAPAAGSAVSATDLFGGLSYNWIEYKMSSSAGGQSMTMYIKYEKSGKCTMRFEGAPQGMPTSMDCSSTGGKAQSNPNDASATPSNVKYIYIGPDVVTVPAGTFTADKYTVTNEGTTSTFWIVKNKGMVKMVGGNGDGSATMELNGMG
jgi:hypothetical protein